MLVIRLQRTGKRNAPAFRIVVADKDAPIKGRSLELIGHYIPTNDPVVLKYNQERIQYWIGQGAHPSNTVARLLTNAGMNGLEKFILTYTKKSKKKTKEEAPAKTKESAAATPAVKEKSSDTTEFYEEEPTTSVSDNEVKEDNNEPAVSDKVHKKEHSTKEEENPPKTEEASSPSEEKDALPKEEVNEEDK